MERARSFIPQVFYEGKSRSLQEVGRSEGVVRPEHVRRDQGHAVSEGQLDEPHALLQVQHLLPIPSQDLQSQQASKQAYMCSGCINQVRPGAAEDGAVAVCPFEVQRLFRAGNPTTLATLRRDGLANPQTVVNVCARAEKCRAAAASQTRLI